ncbi:hypothetical protein K491DRAFT_692905 [Lophiostoma macrostomum CBS 122681]|uniref:Secreted protein n=1 Tax=Lophiostoma macrostomum CBS 122681 TaxID=1314788 RepID=A0A6A6T928_9PLEO|nr:hypothetical protein K491DRAFT_692905 [Lophiostoma macrostomum CBS 122681]
MMHAQILFTLFAVSALAFPTFTVPPATPWEAAPDSAVTCTTTDKVISHTAGIQLNQVLQDACVAMMPPCAYPEQVSNDTACPEITSWALKGVVSSIRDATVENATNTNKLSGYKVEFSVTPASQNSAPVMWEPADCYGYLNHILMAKDTASPKGCYAGSGAGIGDLTVGGASSLTGTVFNVTIVKATA